MTPLHILLLMTVSGAAVTIVTIWLCLKVSDLESAQVETVKAAQWLYRHVEFHLADGPTTAHPRYTVQCSTEVRRI